MFVLPSCRYLGVGTKLLDAIRNFAKETEAKSVVLETSPENLTAQKLYVKNGYSLDNEYLHYALSV